MIYFISDTHFNHANIIKYTERPFQSVEEMDETLIYNWNSIVKKEDDVYHLGDFCFGNQDTFYSYISKLNGNISILKNPDHHDKRWLSYFESSGMGESEITWQYLYKTTKTEEYVTIEDSLVDLKYKQKYFVLCHFPIYIWNRKHYLSYHVYGHSHDPNFSIPNSPLSMNVSVECINYTPISIDKVLEIMENRIKEFDLKPINEEK